MCILMLYIEQRCEMSRMKRCRNVQAPPLFQSFKPRGIAIAALRTVTITLEELEGVRLADHEDLEHEEAATRLGVSRSVFTRLLDGARKKIATALVEGCELRIEGGDYHFENKRFRCEDCQHLFEADLESADPIGCPDCASPRLTNLNLTFGLRGHCRRHGGDLHE